MASIAKKIVLLLGVFLLLALAVAEESNEDEEALGDDGPRRHTYHRGRRLVQQTVECFLYKVVIQSLDQTADEEKWQCELQGADAAKSRLFFVDVEGLDFGGFDGSGHTGAITLLAQGAVIQDGKLKIPPGATQRFNKVEGRGPANKGQGNGNGNGNGNSSEQGRQLNPVPVVRKVLAVRVKAKDVSTTSSKAVISDKVFGTSGDTCNLKERMGTCSFGDLMIEPFSGTAGSKTISAGVYEVSIGSNAKGVHYQTVQNAVVSKLTSDLGTLTNKFDHVMLCLPAGTAGGGWIAYGYIGGYLTVYNDVWCNYPSAQVHEIGHNLGLHHAGEGGVEYADQTGLMGYSYGQDTTLMCYNPAKSWQLNWYSNHRLAWDIASQGRLTNGKLIGIVDYEHAQADGKYVTVKVVPPVPGAPDIFVAFNRKDSFNIETKEGLNQVTVTSQAVYHKSELLAKLSSGGQFTVNNFWYSAPLIIKVNSISTSSSPPSASVDIYLDGCTSNADCTDGNACVVGTCGQYGTCSYSWVGTSCPGNFLMDLTTDDAPGHTSWKVEDLCAGSAIVLSGGSYTAARTQYTKTKNLGLSRFKVTFSDSNGDGLSWGTGFFTATFDGIPVATGIGNFGFQVVGEFGTPCPTPAPAPVTPAPVTPAPVTPAPVTSAPVTPAPVTPAPVSTPAPVTPAPVTPAPVSTPAPVTPAPVTPAPVSTPAPVTPAPAPATWQQIFYDNFAAGFNIFSCGGSTNCKISTLAYQGDLQSLEVKDGKTTSLAFTASSHDVRLYTKVRASFYFYAQNVDNNEKFYLEWKSNVNANWLVAQTFNFGTTYTTNKIWHHANVEWNLDGAGYVELRLRTQFSEGKEKVNFDMFKFEGM